MVRINLLTPAPLVRRIWRKVGRSWRFAGRETTTFRFCVRDMPGSKAINFDKPLPGRW